MFSEERTRSIREAQEKARAEVAGNGAGAATNGRPKNVNTQHGRRVSNDIKSPKSPKSPNPPKGPAVEDGFEGSVARGPKAAPRESPNATDKKKERNTRNGFSFAAAAAANGGLVDEDEEEGEGEGEEKKAVNGHAEQDVAAKMAEVTV